MAADDRNDDDPGGRRRLDEVAVARALRRMAAADSPPWLHAEVARRLGERLVPMRARPQRIVDWWASTGGGAAVVRGAYPKAERVAVEPALARRSSGVGKPPPWWSFGLSTSAPAFTDADSDADIGQAQLVWANMALHLVADPPALIARWHRLLQVEGVLVFSCLGPGTLRELRQLYTEAHWPAPTPDFVDMHDLGDMLVHAGFADPVMDQETLSLRWKDAASMLAELRLLGGNTAPDRFAGLRTPAWRKRMLAALAQRADADGSVGLSVEVAYGHGFKVAPRRAAGEPVAVSLDAMRAMVKKPRR